jgi:restriction system protein
MAVTAKLPWWLGVALAVVSFLVLHAIASQEIAAPGSTADIGTFAAKGLYRSMAWFLQFVVPPLCLVGALVSFIGKRKRTQLVTQVAESPSVASLEEMSWREFEALVEEAFRLRGYSVRRLGGDGPDGGVDLELRRGAETVLVQCKQWRALRVGVSVVRELYGVMAAKGAASGIVVTSGSFTPDAVEFASGRNVRLIAGPELHEMIKGAKAAAPRRQDTPRQDAPAVSGAARGCPVCGSPMVRREAKRGANVGKVFYGCSRYPGCRGVRSID